MTLRTVLLLLIAVVAAGLTAFYARSWITAERAAIMASVPKEAPEPEATKVLVAKKDLSAGSFVNKDNLKWQAWPEEGLIDDYVVQGNRKIEDFVGAVVRTEVTVGQPITDARVVHPGDRGFLAAVLTPGMRAVSVPVNATSGISGFIFPGDSVDVIMTSKYTEKNQSTGDNQTRYFSETLLTEVRVLAIDQKIEQVDGDVAVAKTSTLEVTQKQAEKIAIALEMGSLSLSLHSLAREELEKIQETAGGATPLDVAGRQAEPEFRAKPIPPTNPRSYTMDSEVYYMGAGHLGGEEKTVTILRGGNGSSDKAGTISKGFSALGELLGGKK